MSEIRNREELYHYGVMGMKWGVRRAARKETASLRKGVRKGTVSKEAYNASYKKAKADAVNKLYSKQDAKANEAINNMSTGKALAQSMLMGSYGALKYNEARARGVSKGKAALEGILYNTANQWTGGAVSAAQYIDNRLARKKKD